MSAYPLILLCGGRSERMGNPKGLLEYEKSPLFLQHIRKFQFAGGKYAILVLGYHSDRYIGQIPWIEDAMNKGWINYEGINMAIALNIEPERGQFSSLLTGLEHLDAVTFKGAFIMPVDMLPPDSETWEALRSGMTGGIKACIPVFDGKGGHPVLLAASFTQDLLTLPHTHQEARLDIQIRNLAKQEVNYIQVMDKKITGNMNTPGDLPI